MSARPLRATHTPADDQMDMFGRPNVPPAYLHGLAYHRHRLANDGKRWPTLRPYLAAWVSRYERLCAGIPESEIGTPPEYPR